jgi:hypothetical protein
MLRDKNLARTPFPLAMIVFTQNTLVAVFRNCSISRSIDIFSLYSSPERLTRIVHEVSAASADTRLQRAVSPFSLST